MAIKEPEFPTDTALQDNPSPQTGILRSCAPRWDPITYILQLCHACHVVLRSLNNAITLLDAKRVFQPELPHAGKEVRAGPKKKFSDSPASSQGIEVSVEKGSTHMHSSHSDDQAASPSVSAASGSNSLEGKAHSASHDSAPGNAESSGSQASQHKQETGSPVSAPGDADQSDDHGSGEKQRCLCVIYDHVLITTYVTYKTP